MFEGIYQQWVWRWWQCINHAGGILPETVECGQLEQARYVYVCYIRGVKEAHRAPISQFKIDAIIHLLFHAHALFCRI